MQSFISLLLAIISVSFKLFLFALDTSIHCFCLLNTAQSGEFGARASGESASGESRASEEQASASGGQERKNKKKFPWLQKLMLKFRRGHDGA